MKRTAIILLCLLLVAAFVAPAFGHDKGGKSPAYSVSNPNHTQALGGKSQNAGRGLQIAASRSAAVQGGTVVVPPPK